MRRWFAVLLLPTLAVCGGRTAASTGAPEAVVRAAPDRTLEEVTARVEAAAPDASSAGRLRLSDAGARLRPSGRGQGHDYAELNQPLAVVDLVRGASDVVSYGGTAVRGVSTFRYETLIDVDRAVRSTPEPRREALRAFADRLSARAFYADVWVDGQGRIRRVQLPVEKTAQRPGQRDRRRPRLVTVDLFAFGERVGSSNGLY